MFIIFLEPCCPSIYKMRSLDETSLKAPFRRKRVWNRRISFIDFAAALWDNFLHSHTQLNLSEYGTGLFNSTLITS